ncbi:tryptophan synthase subunit alpha [Alkalicaulis satelles]|uniref:Tryptophan synthase alpha chain n=1 Tax=Alkalicaulis satelles TaxID=2609175 RepID=A0A5M6ZHU9_9PROT|nr:tryptophan synthase subunit alpha [Alkalicaulis satelles]KAA5803880.1 tryptophan synthase subunit alpha [Alkalicaulis satelles]
MTRLSGVFGQLRAEGRAGFIAYVMAGDPDAGATLSAMRGLADAGADILELGVPFTDPMADGPVIQRAAIRALAGGMTLAGTLDLVRDFRATHPDTPVILMGYANPFHAMGYEAFADAAADAGADGVICVDIPPEEDAPLRAALEGRGLAFVRLAAPTTDDARLPQVAAHCSGFVYYVSTTGVTGAGSGETGDIAAAVARVRAASGLPVAVGFGVKTPERAAEIAAAADAVVVGSAIVEALHREGEGAALALARDLAGAVRAAAR